MTTIDDSQRKAAKAAAIAYLLTFAAVVYANFAIHDRLNVAGNAAATAKNILAHEQLFRIGIACDLFYCAGIVVVMTAFYVILKPVSQGLALIALFWKLVYALAWVIMTMNLFDALRLVHGAEYLRAFEPERLHALAKLGLAGRFDRYYGGLLFYALGATVTNYLWFKSRYIPRAFAAFGVIALAWCALCALIFIIEPRFSDIVNPWLFDTPMAVFELLLSFWLLFKGLGTDDLAARGKVVTTV